MQRNYVTETREYTKLRPVKNVSHQIGHGPSFNLFKKGISIDLGHNSLSFSLIRNHQEQNWLRESSDALITLSVWLCTSKKVRTYCKGLRDECKCLLLHI